MVELLVLGSLALVALFVIAVLASVFGLVMWLVFLPFRIFGWLLHALAFVFAVPFLAIFGLVAVVALGAGMLMFALPVLPFVLIAMGAWWLMRRNQRSAATVTR